MPPVRAERSVALISRPIDHYRQRMFLNIVNGAARTRFPRALAWRVPDTNPVVHATSVLARDISVEKHNQSQQSSPSPVSSSRALAYCSISLICLKDMLLRTQCFRNFRKQLQKHRGVYDDWLSLVSRPWVSGPIDEILGSCVMGELLRENPYLGAGAEYVVATLDNAITSDDVDWFVRTFKICRANSGLYSVLGAVERILNEERVAKLYRVTNLAVNKASLTRLLAILQVATSTERVKEAIVFCRWLLSQERINNYIGTMEHLLDEHRLDKADRILDYFDAYFTDAQLLDVLQVASALADPSQLPTRLSALEQVVTEERVEAAVAFMDRAETQWFVNDFIDKLDTALTEERISRLPFVLEVLGYALTEHRLLALATGLDAVFLHPWRRSDLNNLIETAVTTERMERYLSTLDTVFNTERLGKMLDGAALFVKSPAFVSVGTIVDRLLASLKSETRQLHPIDVLLSPPIAARLVGVADIIMTPRRLAVVEETMEGLLCNNTRAAQLQQVLHTVAQQLHPPTALSTEQDGKMVKSIDDVSALLLRVLGWLSPVALQRLTVSFVNILDSPAREGLVFKMVDDFLSNPQNVFRPSLMASATHLLWQLHVDLAMTAAAGLPRAPNVGCVDQQMINQLKQSNQGAVAS